MSFFLNRLHRLSLAAKFALLSLGVLLAAMLGIGWWVSEAIRDGVIHRTTATTALYINSFLEPELQTLQTSARLSAAQLTRLDNLLRQPPLNQQITRLTVWDTVGKVLYSTEPTLQNRVFPLSAGLQQAWNGQVYVRVGPPHLIASDEGNIVATYTPIRKSGSQQVLAVAEVYTRADELLSAVRAAQQRSWLVVGLVFLGAYGLLAGLVKRGSDTIWRQQADLEALHARVRGAASRGSELNERFLRRTSAELHDGPAQELSFALLKLDGLLVSAQQARPEVGQRIREAVTLASVQESLAKALREMRQIAAGLRLPDLEPLSLGETLERAVRDHQRRTQSEVKLLLGHLPAQPPLPVKIAVFRLVQESLTNAYRHGWGVDQQVRLDSDETWVRLEVSDGGPGFSKTEGDEHLGLAGMRERVESLGGAFSLESTPGQGTRVRAVLPLGEVGRG